MAVNVLSVPPARHAAGDYQPAAGPRPAPAAASPGEAVWASPGLLRNENRALCPASI